MSNVSFGIPERRLINDVFLVLAIEAGADSGIIDPIDERRRARHSLSIATTRPFQLALDVLTGADRNCRAYMKAYRAGELEQPELGMSPARATMARYRILSWGGIPAQLKVFDESGRRPLSVELDDWFMQEIDRVAMRDGLIGTDEYLERWAVVGRPRAPGYRPTRSLPSSWRELEAEWIPSATRRRRRPRPEE